MKFLFDLSSILIGALHVGRGVISHGGFVAKQGVDVGEGVWAQDMAEEVGGYTEHSFEFVFEELSCHKYCSNSNLNSF